MRRCLRNEMVSRVDKKPDRDRHADGRTDGWIHGHSIYRAIIASRGKKINTLTKLCCGGFDLDSLL